MTADSTTVAGMDPGYAVLAWNRPVVARVMVWTFRRKGIDDDEGYWQNELADLLLSDVVMAQVLEEMPAGRWAVVLTLRTNPVQELIVDGNLDTWWWTHDSNAKKGMGMSDGG